MACFNAILTLSDCLSSLRLFWIRLWAVSSVSLRVSTTAICISRSMDSQALAFATHITMQANKSGFKQNTIFHVHLSVSLYTSSPGVRDRCINLKTTQCLFFVASRHVALRHDSVRKRNVFHCQTDWISQSQISLFTSAGMRQFSEGLLRFIKAIHHLSGTVTAHKRNAPVGRCEAIRATKQWSSMSSSHQSCAPGKHRSSEAVEGWFSDTRVN